MKAYTDLEQSKKLAEILPIESADMIHNILGKCYVRYDTPIDKYHTPAWSLAALLDVLPDEITDDGVVYRNMVFHLKGKYIIQYPRLTSLWPSLLSVESDNIIDACVEMIIKLHENNLL